MKSDKKFTYQELEKQITVLKKHQENGATKGEQHYQDLFNSMSEIFMLVELIYNKSGKVIDFYYREVNPAFEKLVGKSKEELINKRAKDVFNIIDEHWLDVYEKVDKTGQPISYSNHSGELNRYYSSQAWKLKKGIIATTFMDITEQKQAEDELKQANDRNFKMLFDSSTDMFQILELVYDSGGKPIDYYYREVNPAFERLVGKTREQLINKKVLDLFSIVEDYWLEIYHSVATTGKTVNFENYGGELDKYYKVISWKVAENKVAVIFTDVTEQKRKEIDLKQVKEKADAKIVTQNKEIESAKAFQYSMLFNSMSNMFQILELIYDSEGKPIDVYVREANPAFEQLVGKTRKQLINKRANALFGIVEDYWLDMYHKVVTTGKSINLENYSGEFNQDYKVICWKIDDHKVAVIFTDITEKKRKEIALKQANEKAYKMLLNSTTDMFQIMELIYDKDGKPIDCYYREVNPALEKMTGKTKAQLVNKRMRDLFGLEDYWLELYQKVITTGESSNFEDYGAEFDQHYLGICWKVDDTKVAVIFSDITEKKRKEKALEKVLEKALEKADEKIVKQNIELQRLDKIDLLLTEESFNLYFKYLPSPTAIYKLEKDGRLILQQANGNMTKLLGLKSDALVGKAYLDLFPNKKDSKAHKILHSIAQGEFKSQKYIDHYQDNDLSIWSEVTFFNLGENIVGAVSFDISNQKIVELELDKSHNKYKMLFDSMTEMVGIIELIYDTQGKPIDYYFRDFNQAFLNFLGKTKDQVINGKASVVIGTIEDYWLKAFASVDKTGTAVHLDDYGVAFDKYYSVKAWKTDKNLVGIAIMDVSEKRRIKIEKAETKLTLENLKKDTEETQKLANIGSWIFNSETQIPQWSDEMFNIWAFDSEQGVPDYKTIVKRIHPEDCQLYNSAVNNAINQGTPFNIEFRIQIPNRDQKIINGICKPILGGDAKSIIIQGINQDITKQKLFENDLVEHERLKAIGEMSASIAHDFNNSLQEMSGNLEILILRYNLSDTARDRIINIRSIIEDVAGRVNALQHFGDTAHYSKKAELINFNTVIEQSITESRPLWKDNMEKDGLTVHITTSFGDIPDINCDRGELKSAIHNLIKNSIEAMPKGGDIRIKTGTNAEGIFAAFTDTGIGMDEETKLKVFQPFYSTKGFKLGRGLGMSGVYSTIKKNKGTVNVVFSELGKGTTIEIVFPIGKQKDVKDIPQNDPKPKDKAAFRVLWVDDDATIRENASEILELIGHTCDHVSSGKQALESLHKNTYDIVFTDIGMPEMNGWQLTDLIRKSFGNSIKIVVVTGWYVDEKTKNEHDVNFVLQKPFAMKALEKTLTLL